MDESPPLGISVVSFLRARAMRLTSVTWNLACCALMFATGSSLEEIASNLGAARSTVRAHLRSLFHKTGTNRQGALVAILNRELAVLAVLTVLADRESA